jgi:hypothetical protein
MMLRPEPENAENHTGRRVVRVIKGTGKFSPFSLFSERNGDENDESE